MVLSDSERRAEGVAPRSNWAEPAATTAQGSASISAAGPRAHSYRQGPGLGQSRSENLRNGEPGCRKRARQSCDACKNRKTKCIPAAGNLNGPCRYCTSIGQPCSTSIRLQRRPFYRVSEEEYDCSMRLLRHFVGVDTTLDLATMKTMLADIDKGAGVQVNVSHSTVETEESEVLQEELGCMIIDARGSYRYVGPDSSVRFANAAQVASNVSAPPLPHRTDPDPSVIVPLVQSRLPPDTPESVHSPGSDGHVQPTQAGNDGYSHGHRRNSNTVDSQKDRKVYYLPDRDVCQRYCMRFFEELQSIYWFFSPEHFYTMVDKTYADGGVGISASWLCSLYCIFSICAARNEATGRSQDEQNQQNQGQDGGRKNVKKSSEYLAMAKSLGLQVCDEADADAVRALALMSLALYSSCYTVTAYLIIGMTVRIAYSLGLHRNINTRNQDSVTGVRLHRLWWTVYLLDQEVAIQLGYPYAIVDDVAGLRTPLPCESILDPGRHTPHGYQAVCVALVKLKKKISHTLYVAPALSTRKVPFSAVAGCMAELRDWLAALPPHLGWSDHLPPPHRRAVAVLHLRYWTTLIHVQRPFLLYTVARGAELAADQRRWYEELSVLCLDAADKSVAILRNMRDHCLLSSLVLFDSWCIQELAHVFLLGRQYMHRDPARAAAAAEGLDTCMSTLRGMEAVGWADKILPELVAQVDAWTPKPDGSAAANSHSAAAAATAAAVGGGGNESDATRHNGQEEASTSARMPENSLTHGLGLDESPSQEAQQSQHQHQHHPHPQAQAPSMDTSEGGQNGSFFEFSNFQDFDFSIDAQLDVFDTLDLDMETFVAPPQDGMFFT